MPGPDVEPQVSGPTGADRRAGGDPADGSGAHPAERHAAAVAALGVVGPSATTRVDAAATTRASRSWWDADAADYHRTHADFLGVDAPGGAFVWCPEDLHEDEAGLLGDVAGRDVLEVGCGSAPCSRWLAARGARPVGLDLSGAMLARGAAATAGDPRPVPLVQATAEALPFADGSFDLACSAFGAVPFVADPGLVMAEVARVLRPGGRWVFATNHPLRWVFPDDPGPRGLTATIPYFDRSPYVEVDEAGVPTYVEHHRTMGDRVRDVVAAGLVLLDVVEPAWPEHLDREWGQWSPLRGEIFPGTAIFVCRKPA